MDCTNTGCFAIDDLEFPDDDRLKKGAVAVVECSQEIPCNPCSSFCPQGAIKIGSNINDCPHIDWTACNGCGLCLGYCPGLALFLIDNSKEKPRLTIPFELTPPVKGTEVALLDRSGKIVGLGQVVDCRILKKHDRTSLVTLELENPKQLRLVRGFTEVNK